MWYYSIYGNTVETVIYDVQTHVTNVDTWFVANELKFEALMKHVVDVDAIYKRKFWLRQFARDNITRQRISHVNYSVSEIVFTLFLHLVNPSLQFSVFF